METRGLVSTAVLVAVLVLCATPSLAFVPQAQVQADYDWQYTARQWFAETPVAYQYKVAGAMRYASTGFGTYPWGVKMAYDTFESDDQKGRNLTGILGYHAPRDPLEEAIDDLAWGIVSIEEWWCCGDYDWVLYEGVAPYISYRYQDLTVGGYVLAGYTFSDEPEISEELFYGVGAAAAYRWKLADDWSITPRLSAQYYDSGQSSWEESLSFTASAGVKFDVTDRVSLGASFDYTKETADDVLDDDWYGFGVKVSGQLSDYIKASAGAKITQGFDGPGGANFDNTTLHAGLRLIF